MKKCDFLSELEEHVQSLFIESPTIMAEEYLSSEEATVTVMPPTHSHSTYWALPIVSRFNHIGGIALYNGVVAVTANSRVVSQAEYSQDPNYARVDRECEDVALELRPTAPIRIDVRRFTDEAPVCSV